MRWEHEMIRPADFRDSVSTTHVPFELNDQGVPQEGVAHEWLLSRWLLLKWRAC